MNHGLAGWLIVWVCGCGWAAATATAADPPGYVELERPAPIRVTGPDGGRVIGKLRAYSEHGFAYLTADGNLHAVAWAQVAYVQQFVEEHTGVPWHFAISGSY